MKKYLLVILSFILVIEATGQTKKTVVRQTSKRTVSKAASTPLEVKKDTPPEFVKDVVVNFAFKSNNDALFETEDGKGYYIANFSKKSAHELYTNTLARIARIYNSPERVTEKIEDNTVVINGIVQTLLSVYDKEYGVRIWYDFNYKLEFNFKEGRIRINAPLIVGGVLRTGSLNERDYYPGNFVLSNVLSKDRSRVYILEDYLNKLITEIVYGNSKDEDW